MVAKKLLRDTHPELRVQFNTELNSGISFDELFVIFEGKVFWNCPEGHLILQKPRGRTQDKCAACAVDRNRKYLKDHHRNLIAEFDIEGNDGIDPQTLYSRSPGLFSWICQKSNHRHAYFATVKSRIMGHSCPYCGGGSILPGYNDWMTLEPLDNLLWLYEKNLDSEGQQVDPAKLGVDNRVKYHWLCVTGNHERIISISGAVNGKRTGKECRVCSGYKCISGVSDALTLFPVMRERLHPTMNLDIDVENLHPGNRDVEINWICIQGHTWRRSFAEELKSKGCGKCSGKELWKGHNDLLSQFPEIAAELAYDLNLNQEGFVQVPPESLHKHSGLDSWWRCEKYGHFWRTKVEKRTREGTGCPFCSDRRVWPGFNDLWTRRPDLVNEIDFEKHPGLEPRNLLWVSHILLNWKCSENHQWPAQLSVRSSNSSRKPTGCPTCSVSGFKPGEPAIIYFIENMDLLAYKVGISNTGTGRLRSWLGSGWSLVKSFSFERGYEASYVEAKFHFWRRNVLQQPDFLSKADVGRMGGWTETFHNQSVSPKTVEQKLEEIIASRHSSLN